MKRIRPNLKMTLIGLNLLLVLLSGSAQSTPLARRTPMPDVGESSSSIVIKPGDTLAVTVFDAPELSRDVRVSGDGTVNLPLLNNLLVAGLTESQAAHQIDAAYLQAKMLLRPQTSVLIRDFATRGVAILGEVVHPGLFPVPGPRSLLDVLAQAGGFTNLADSRVDIKRADGTLELGIRLPLENGEEILAHDVVVSPGDRVVAKRASTVFVVGEVAKPGGYLMQYDGSITLLQAIAQANGTTRISRETDIYLIRRSGDTYTTRHVELRKMYKGRLPDFNLEAGDVVYVPGSTVRNFVVNAPEILGTLAGAAIYSTTR